jgi:uncharacterized protein YndB with AHSA1/START domain
MAMQWLFMQYLKALKNQNKENMNNEPLIIERTFNVPVQKVWKALTNKDQMDQWCFKVSDFKAEVGFEFTFEGKRENMTYHHICKITEVEFCKKLAYTWRYEGHPGSSLVTFELSTGGETTLLKLTHTGLETFPNTADFEKNNYIQGWNHIIGKALKEFLEKPE